MLLLSPLQSNRKVRFVYACPAAFLGDLSASFLVDLGYDGDKWHIYKHTKDNKETMARSITLRGNIKAPNIDVEDIYGNRINLRNYRGKRVFLGFFRHAGCPFCNLRVNKLESAAARLKEKNLEMIFLFESTKMRLLASKYHTDIHTIPMIADPEKELYNLYGVENSPLKSAKSHFMSLIQTAIKAKLKSLPVHWMADNESISTIPAEFLIDEQGVIKVVHYARDLMDELSTDLITRFADEGVNTNVHV